MAPATKSSALIFGRRPCGPRDTWFLLPPVQPDGGPPWLGGVPVSDELLADLDGIPQQFEAGQMDELLADLLRYRDHAWGISCSILGARDESKVRRIPGSERLYLPQSAGVIVRFHMMERIDLSDPSRNHPPYTRDVNLRARSLGRTDFDPKKPLAPLDLI